MTCSRLALKLGGRTGFSFRGIRLAAEEFGNRDFESGDVVDDILTKTRGKLTKVASSVSTTEYTGFDILGRVTAHKQTTDGQQYTTGYTYNLSGALVEQTYPSGRVVKNTLDVDGRLSQVQSAKSGQTLRNYANGFNYNAAGAVTSMRLGNGLWETTQFNSRLQPTQIGLGNGSATPNKLKLDYAYGTAANNGNLLSQTITVPSVAHPFVQNYSYDSLNRLKNATETQNSTQTWKQTFTFDRYGNRNFDEANTTTLPKECNNNTEVCAAIRPVVNPSVNTTNNRLNGYTFDTAGNTTIDAENRTFVYDAENKQVEVKDSQNATVGQYVYDGDGRRIKKIVPGGETTVFVYDAGGKLIGEYSTVVQPVQDAKTVYTTNDHLGSPRINTDGLGNVVARHDYHPFGEEIYTTARTSGLGYSADTIRKQFTGYERDNEANLDFAQARMFGFSLGRFTSPDPLMASAKRILPQSWNRYTYVLNNPLNLVDPTGMVWGYRTLKDGSTEYCYAKGKAVCDGFKKYTGDGILENPSVNGRELGYAIRLLPGGGWERVVPISVDGAPRGWLSQKDAEAINAITGGAICSLSAGFACPNKGEKIADNVAVAGDVVQVVFLIKSLIKLGLSVTTIAAIIKKSPDEVAGLIEKVSSGAIKEVGKDFFEGTKYSNKVLGQMKKGDFHSFPESVKAFQGDGVISTIKGADGVTREMLSIPGSYKGKAGVFEFIKESDGTINHRFFRPDP